MCIKAGIANTGLVCVVNSIGMALTDTLDDLISDERINPQLAMKILGNFDQAITEALQKEVKTRLSFKVSPRDAPRRRPILPVWGMEWR